MHVSNWKRGKFCTLAIKIFTGKLYTQMFFSQKIFLPNYGICCRRQNFHARQISVGSLIEHTKICLRQIIRVAKIIHVRRLEEPGEYGVVMVPETNSWSSRLERPVLLWTTVSTLKQNIFFWLFSSSFSSKVAFVQLQCCYNCCFPYVPVNVVSTHTHILILVTLSPRLWCQLLAVSKFCWRQIFVGSLIVAVSYLPSLTHWA